MKTEISQSVTVGVDTGKHTLDIHVRPLGIDFTVSNDAEGIGDAIKTLKPYRPSRLVIEATGGYECQFIMPGAVSSFIKPILTALNKQIRKIDEKLIALIESSPDYKATSDIIQSMPGMGKVSAATLISYLPELGLMNSKQAAS